MKRTIRNERLNSVLRNFQNQTLKQLQARWLSLTEPVVTITDHKEREQSRLLASLLLGGVLCGLPVVALPFILNVEQGLANPQVWNGLFEVAMTYLMYRYSRQGYYQRAVRWIALFGSGSILVGAFLMGGLPGLHVLYFLTIILLFAGLFLSRQFMLGLMAIHVSLMLLYAWLDPGITLVDVILGPVVFNLVMGALTILIVGHRARLDRVQQADMLEVQERYRIISEMISDYAYSFRVNPNRSVEREWLTDSFARVMGYSKQEVQDNLNLNVYHPDERDKVEADFAAVLRGEERADEYRVITKAGEERWLRLSRRPVWDSEQGRVVRIYGAAQDITAHKQAEGQKFESALAQARFDLVHRFFRAISHDFRTSLSIIETNRYLVERLIERGETEEIHCRLKNISEQVMRLTEQLENLKVVSSLNSPVIEPCDLQALAEAEAASFGDEIEAQKLTLNIEMGEPVPAVRGNAEELRRAIGHLLENAIHFTPEGGSITLAVYQSDDTVRLDVRDTGVGIQPDDLTHIFDLFYRADEARSIESGGVGLGLSIVKMVAEAYGGSVSVQSQPNLGSTFTMAFPTVPNRAPVSPQRAEPQP